MEDRRVIGRDKTRAARIRGQGIDVVDAPSRQQACVEATKVPHLELAGIDLRVFGRMQVDTAYPIAPPLQRSNEMVTDEASRAGHHHARSTFRSQVPSVERSLIGAVVAQPHDAARLWWRSPGDAVRGRRHGVLASAPPVRRRPGAARSAAGPTEHPHQAGSFGVLVVVVRLCYCVWLLSACELLIFSWPSSRTRPKLVRSATTLPSL